MDIWVTDKTTVFLRATSTNTHMNWPNVIQIEGTNINSVEQAYRKTGQTDEWKD
jgi:hypothetical protein